MRARVLVLVMACVVAVGAGFGMARWQADPSTGGESADDAAAGEEAAKTPESVDYLLTEVPLPDDSAETVVASAAGDEDRVLVGTDLGHVYSVDLSAGEAAVPELVTSLPGSVRNIDVSADGETVAVVGTEEVGEFGLEGTLRVTSLSGGESADFPMDVSHGPGGLSSDGELLVFGSFDLTVLEVATGETSVLPDKPLGVEGSRTAYEDWAVTGDGQLRAAGVDGVNTWDRADPDVGGATVGCQCAAWNVSLDAEGSHASFGTSDGHVVVVDVDDDTVLADKTITTDPDERIWSTTLLGDADRSVVGTVTGRVMVWDVSGSRTLWEHSLPGYHVERVDALPDSDAFLIHAVEAIEPPEWGEESDTPPPDVRVLLAHPKP